MRHPIHVLPLTAVALSSLLAACSGEGPVQALADAQATSKLNAYVECFNGVGQPVQESMQRYVSWIADLDAGPTGKETLMRGPGTVLSHRVEACGAPMTAALEQAPADPVLDPVARRYQQAFQAVHGKIEEASRYYDREDYKRDGGEGMKRLHAPLMEAYTAFHAASGEFSDALDVKEDQRRQQQIAQVEKEEGRSVNYYQLRVLGEAKALVQALNDEAPDLAAAQAQLQVFQQLLDEAQKDGIGAGDAMWGHVQRSADGLVRQAGRRIERISSNTPLSRSEELLMQSGTFPQGSQETLLEAYNDLVDMSNRRSR